MEKMDILAFGAHPDDVELGCGGTIARLIKEGKKIAIVDLTKGELGTRGNADTRKVEAENAAKILGVTTRINLGIKDGFIENTEDNQMEVIKMIRHFQPEIVLANAIDDRHPDHAKAAKLVSDACFLSGLIKIKTSYNNDSQTVWRPKKIFNYIQWKSINPDFVIDISSYLETKIQACLAFSSQFYDPDSQEPVTPIATKDFLESITYRAQDLGRLSGVQFAEGFTVEQLLAFKNFEGFIL